MLYHKKLTTKKTDFLSDSIDFFIAYDPLKIRMFTSEAEVETNQPEGPESSIVIGLILASVFLFRLY